MLLDTALKEQILNDHSRDSTLLRIKDTLNKGIDWNEKFYPEEEKEKFYDAISGGRLPKFDSLQDMINGMGITVHDTWATHITIMSLDITGDQYRAVIHYKVQDHFGLDNDDILQIKYHPLRFFRIWFVLQRYHQFGFRPFMTDMDAIVEITGGPNDK